MKRNKRVDLTGSGETFGQPITKINTADKVIKTKSCEALTAVFSFSLLAVRFVKVIFYLPKFTVLSY